MLRDGEKEHVPTLSIHSGPRVDQGRNTLFRTWLQETDCDRILMLDDDMVYPADTIKRLRGHNKDLVGGMYFAGSWAGHVKPAVSVAREMPDGQVTIEPYYSYPLNALVPVEGLGGGFMMVTRRCAEAVWEARGINHPMPWFAHGMHNNFPIGEDIAFCLTAMKVGFQAWCDTGLEADHMKSLPVNHRNYVASLNDESHPCYNQRQEIPIYTETVDGHSGLDSDRPSVEGIPEALGTRLVTVGPDQLAD
jgi:hypothetical protein